MTKISSSVFSSPLMLGFDHFERILDRLSKAPSESYPPYNIEQVGSHGFRITLALAGFESRNLEVELEDNQLTIKGNKSEEDESRNYIYRGIANRQFIKTFILAEGIKVLGAEFKAGLLHINLVRPQSSSNAQRISIKDMEQISSTRKSLTYDIEDK